MVDFAEKALADLGAGAVSREMLGVHEEMTLVPSSISLGALPPCTVLDIGQGIIAGRAFVVVATDKGVFVAEVGKSRLTKLDLLASESR